MNKRALRMRGFAPLVLLASALLVSDVSAHRTNYCLSELTWRVDQQNLEIVHSVHLDDAVVLLAALGDPNANLSASTEAALLEYLTNTFTLSLDGEQVEVTAVGVQIVGDNLWLYQEVELERYPERLEVSTRFLFDLFPDQSHQVNFGIGSQVETLLLDRQTAEGRF